MSESPSPEQNTILASLAAFMSRGPMRRNVHFAQPLGVVVLAIPSHPISPIGGKPTFEFLKEVNLAFCSAVQKLPHLIAGM